VTREPALSVVVCTHNRPLDLERCLERLAALEDPAQVIVVDSASQPPCGQLVARYADRIEELVYVREERTGHSRARNRGVAVANGDVIAFLDDDAAPRPDWARRIVGPFAAEPEIGCVGGACHAVFPDGARPEWLSERLLQFAAITRFGPEAREVTSSAEWPFGANMAFRREALEEGGPFPEALGREGTNLLSGDDSALIEAVRRSGWKIWIEPSAVVDHAVHAERCRSEYYWRRLWWQGVTRARAQDGRAAVGLRLLAAAPLRLCLYVGTRDRVYLYRLAETGGYFAERLRPGRELA
jgi:cellulose synthase/poly-beta-1,6-N-acetylglucosamine synthase-like glycosyltransferase